MPSVVRKTVEDKAQRTAVMAMTTRTAFGFSVPNRTLAVSSSSSSFVPSCPQAAPTPEVASLRRASTKAVASPVPRQRRGNGGRGSRWKRDELGFPPRQPKSDRDGEQSVPTGRRVPSYRKKQIRAARANSGTALQDEQLRILRERSRGKDLFQDELEAENRGRPMPSASTRPRRLPLSTPKHLARSLSDLKVGEKVRGTVLNVVRHGAYVDVGATTDGLVHVREMSTDFVYSPSDMVQVGENVDVWIKYVNAARNVIGLTMLEPPSETPAFTERIPISEIKLGERYEGVVTRITNFGAFVDIGAERRGFVHVSCLWGRRPRETLDHLRLGRRIWVHVDEVDEVRSFIRLRARGRVEDEPLEKDSELGGTQKVEMAATVDPRVVLQRFGEDISKDPEEDENKEDGITNLDVGLNLDDIDSFFEDDDDEDDDEDEVAEDDEDADDAYELDMYDDEDPRSVSRKSAPKNMLIEDFGIESYGFGDAVEDRDIGEEWSDPETNRTGKYLTSL